MKHLLLALTLLSPLFSAAAGGFGLKEQERIVLLGSTIIEREQQFGCLETALTLAAGENSLTMRNLGWSGDTVFGHARSYFGPPQEGLERLSKHLEMLKPSLLITCYGSDLAFEGLEKLPEFLSGYRDLLELVRAKSPHVRIVIIAPPPLENLGPPLPDLTEHNARLVQVRDALKEFASKQDATFVDSFALMGGGSKEKPAKPLTDNGLHYSEAGYQLWADKIVEGLGLQKVSASKAQTEPVRLTVVEKDRLFFNRWRPANETYLFGFRKHEQGQNAKEMEQFDPLVEAQDKKIHELKLALLQATKKLP
jgi:lysophospholipase L1-like esterase